MTQQVSNERNRKRRGEAFMTSRAQFPLEQEACLELPLSYTADVDLPSRVGVFLHAFHLDLLSEVRAYLDHIPFPIDLFISTDTEEKQDAIQAALMDWPTGRVTVEVVPNRGRDIAAKLYGFGGAHDDYEYVLHLHTKQSPHDDRLAGWRGYIYQTLLGSSDTIRGCFAAFAACRSLGILAPQHVDELRPWIRWGVNHKVAEELAMRLGFRLPLVSPLDFPSGSMFWARTAAIKPLLDLGLGFYDFPEEQGQTDGTLAHAIERLFYLVCEEAGFSWMKIAAKGALHDQRGSVAVSGPNELARFLRQRPVNLTGLRGTRRLGREEPVITSAPPKPRRVLHVLWQRALGEMARVPEQSHTSVALLNRAANDGVLLATVQRELAGLSRTMDAEIIQSTTVTLLEVLERFFARGADLVLLFNQSCMLLPNSIEALRRMAVAHGNCALIEGMSVPDLHPKHVDTHSLEIESIGGPVFAVTRAAYERIGCFDGRLSEQQAQQALSSRARSLGVPLLKCPRALFYLLDNTHDTEKLDSAETHHPGLGESITTGIQGGHTTPDDSADVDGGKIDVIIRLYDTTDLPRLRLCVFSLLGQKRGTGQTALTERIHVNVMTQRFTVEQIRQTRETIDPLIADCDDVSLTIYNWDYRDPFDIRVPLLNWAFEVTNGRFVSVVECVELLLPGALARLRARLADTDAAAAISEVYVQQVLWWGDVILPVTIKGRHPEKLSAPLAMFDRGRIKSSLTFEVSSSGMEVANYVNTLRPSCTVNEELRTVQLCVRQAID